MRLLHDWVLWVKRRTNEKHPHFLQKNPPSTELENDVLLSSQPSGLEVDLLRGEPPFSPFLLLGSALCPSGSWLAAPLLYLDVFFSAQMNSYVFLLRLSCPPFPVARKLPRAARTACRI